jgi:3',5'-cyclic AMP phosphodiesterase CpdA
MLPVLKHSFQRILAAIALLALACVPHGAESQRLNDDRIAGDVFYFVQITDTHFGERDHAARTRKLVDQINGLPYDIACVVHTGDIFADNIADTAVREEGLGALKRLRAPLHLLPGNHDILESRLEDTLQAYTHEVGPLLHQAEYRGVVFVFAYTEPAAMGFRVPGYDPLKAIEAAFAQAAGKPVILFHHRPAVDDYYEFALHPGWEANARVSLQALLRAHRVQAVITGHFHRDELHRLDGIPVFAAPPVAGYWGRQASFRLYEYRDGRLGYRTVYLRE